MCGSEIFQFESLIQSVIDHYDLKDDEAEQASDLLYESLARTDMDDAEGGSLCSYCSYIMNKDD